jgi:hypothetical protein
VSNKDDRKAKAAAHKALQANDKKNRGVNSNPSRDERNNSDGKKENHSQKAKGQTNR